MASRALTLFYGLVALLAATVAAGRSTGKTSSKLPVIMFHGVIGNRHNWDGFVANLTAEGRIAVPLSFCENDCTLGSIKSQVPLAIKQVREIVANNASFKDGYIFVAHSQGGQISRSVIENMDDHKVKRYISLAGVQNGVFFGPADAELAAGGSGFNNYIFSAFNFSKYSTADYVDGTLPYDLHEFLLLNPQVHYQYAFANHERTPVHAAWAASNPHLPLVNNVNPCATNDADCAKEKARRKANFLKLERADFFGSPDDGLVTPWQTQLLGQYSEVDSLEEIKTKFQSMTVLNMTATREYVNDTYGLKTLDKRGRLQLHAEPGVPHNCWVADSGTCKFATVYDRFLYALLQ